MVVWYIEKEGELVGVISRELPNSRGMLKEAQEYTDCVVWVFTAISWYRIPSNSADSAVWEEGDPPESVLMAKMIGE